MFTYDSVAAMADEHRARLLADADRARLVRTARRGQVDRWRWVAGWRRRPAPVPVPVTGMVERRMADRRVASVPVPADRRVAVDRRARSLQFRPPVDRRVAARPV